MSLAGSPAPLPRAALRATARATTAVALGAALAACATAPAPEPPPAAAEVPDPVERIAAGERDAVLVGSWRCSRGGEAGGVPQMDTTLTLAADGEALHAGTITVEDGAGESVYLFSGVGVWAATGGRYAETYERLELRALDDDPASRALDREALRQALMAAAEVPYRFDGETLSFGAAEAPETLSCRRELPGTRSAGAVAPPGSVS